MITILAVASQLLRIAAGRPETFRASDGLDVEVRSRIVTQKPVRTGIRVVTVDGADLYAAATSRVATAQDADDVQYEIRLPTVAEWRQREKEQAAMLARDGMTVPPPLSDVDIERAVRSR